MEPKNELILVVESTELDKPKAQILLENFTGFFDQAKEWEMKAKSLVVTDASQVAEMRLAREARLALKEIRVNAEKRRKDLKEQSLREGRAVDGIANVIKALIVPIEEHLEKQEKFAEFEEQRKKDALLAERVAQLRDYVQDTNLYNLADMTEQGFTELLESSKIAFEARKEAERKAEEARLEKERLAREEQERTKEENERLRKEADAERAEKERIQRELDDKKRAEEKAARDAKEKADAEKKAADEALRKAQAEPDKAQLSAWVSDIATLSIPPKGLSVEGLVIAEEAQKKILAVVEEAEQKIRNLF